MELFNTDQCKLSKQTEWACYYKLLLPAKCNREVLQSWFYKASFLQHWFSFSKIYIIYRIYNQKTLLRALLDIEVCFSLQFIRRPSLGLPKMLDFFHSLLCCNMENMVQGIYLAQHLHHFFDLILGVASLCVRNP